MSVPTMSQRRAASATSTTVPGTFASALETAVTAGQQALDNGLLLPDPQTQMRSTAALSSAARSSMASNRIATALPATMSSGGSAIGSPLFPAVSGRRARSPVFFSPDPVIGTTIDEDPSLSIYSELPDEDFTTTFVPTTKKTLSNRLFPVTSTADKLQVTVSRIPRYVYVLAAIVLLAGLWMFLWRHMILQFTFGRRKGQASKCNGKRGNTGLIQFGGAKELEHSPDWEFVLGSGVPTHIHRSKDAIASVGVHAAVHSPMAETTVITTPATGIVSVGNDAVVTTGGQVVNAGETVTIASSTPKTATAHLLETVGVYGFQ